MRARYRANPVRVGSQKIVAEAKEREERTEREGGRK